MVDWYIDLFSLGVTVSVETHGVSKVSFTYFEIYAMI